MDNATIHKAAEIEEELNDGNKFYYPFFLININLVLSTNGIQILYLPAYRPELNPNEKIFGQVKNFLRFNRNTKIPLWIEVTKAFSKVQFKQVEAYFKSSYSLENLETVC